MKGVQVTNIIHHNIHMQTDKLYDPLRETLERRSLSRERRRKNEGDMPPQINNPRVSHDVRRLSPEQAYKMQKNIFIPASRRLVPTSDTRNVQTKQFKIVDMNVREYKPITQEQFQFQQGIIGPSVKQIVYKVDSNSQSEKQAPFNENIPLNKQVFKGGTTISMHPTKFQQSNIQASPPQLKKAQIFSSESGHLRPSEQRSIMTQVPEKFPRKLRQKFTKRKPEYKYNLFSILDHPTNTKCESCWAENELIATKPASQRWR